MKFSWSGENGLVTGAGIESVTGSYYKNVTFSNPMSDVNYAVVCNGAMNSGGGAELQLYSYSKTVNGFTVKGAHGGGADPIGVIDCIIY